VRHAEAALHAPQGDRERPLTARGQADAHRLGAYFRASKIIPGLVLVSPARRARDTLAAVLREMPRKPAAVEVESSLYDADGETLFNLVARTTGEVETMLIVGHNPGLGEFARFLVGAERALPRHFPAPCLAAIGFSRGNWSEACALGGGRLEHFESFSSLPGDDDVSPTCERL
jgi:phosphohistidine phosphatase